MSTNPVSRQGASNEEVSQFFGPLAGLIGTWSGNKGVNLIAVPDQKGSFTLLVAPYTETLTVTALSSPTPNRGLKTIDEIPTLMYSLMIHNSIDNSLMHAENGIWELINPSDNNGYNLARITTVPHGDAILALGNSSLTQGAPNIDQSLSGLPFIDKDYSAQLPLDYSITYERTIVPGFNNELPNTFLTNYLAEQAKNGLQVIESTNLSVSTANKGGGLNNIPSIDNNAHATIFSSNFWIETVKDTTTGKTFQQLQYSQNTTIDFPISSTPAGQTIHWPHINVNTLIKQ